jgi:hypothetical protein
MIDDMKHLTRGKQVNYYSLSILNMSNIFGVKLGEICVADFLNVMRFLVPADSGLWRPHTLLLGMWFWTY